MGLCKVHADAFPTTCSGSHCAFAPQTHVLPEPVRASAFGKGVFADVIHLRFSTGIFLNLGRVPNPLAGVLRRGEEDAEAHRGRGGDDRPGRDSCCPRPPSTWALLQLQEAKGGPPRGLGWELPAYMSAAPGFQTSNPSKCEGIRFLWFEATQL